MAAVIPAQAGSQNIGENLDSGVRRNDDLKKPSIRLLRFALLASCLAASPANAINWHLPQFHLPQMPSAADTLSFEGGLKSFGLQLGVAEPTPTNRFNRLVKPGPTAALQYFYYPVDWIAFGGEIGFSGFGKRTGSPVTPLVPGSSSSFLLSTKAQAVNLSLLARFNLRTEASWTPYLTGGVGYGQISASWGVSNLPPNATLAASGGVTSGFDAIGAAGLEAFVFRGCSLSFEARYTEYMHSAQVTHLVGSPQAGTVLPILPTPIESLSYLLGIHFWFGG